jgi:hypothetical protein
MGIDGATKFQIVVGSKTYMLSFHAQGTLQYIKGRYSRITNNVFGNGSRDVWQSGWRRVQPGGATHQHVVDAFRRFQRLGAVAQTVRC